MALALALAIDLEKCYTCFQIPRPGRAFWDARVTDLVFNDTEDGVTRKIGDMNNTDGDNLPL
jgi:hypothetical protein